jgi:hypothetical protein
MEILYKVNDQQDIMSAPGWERSFSYGTVKAVTDGFLFAVPDVPVEHCI